jgi:ABC-type amino acid transport substrate-binding protein
MENKAVIINFCKNHCCPVVKKIDDKIILGDENGPEGVTTWTADQFAQFIKAVKSNKFDFLISND